MKKTFPSNYKFLILCLWIAFTCIPRIGQSQNTSNEQVKRLQRAIFIFNFAEQVTWQNQNNITDFKIGVLGQDRTFIDLKSLSQKRKIKNKQVTIVCFNSVKDVANVQLLYVNQAQNFDIDYILNKISGKNILLVSEDYSYKSSMINMVNVGDTFEYETNEKNIYRENFTTANSLQSHAVSSSEKWKKLYKTTEASLEESKKIEAEKQAEIDEKEKELDRKTKALLYKDETITTQKDSINSISNIAKKREKWIQLLSSESDLQQQKLESKIALERELEETILSQLAIVKAQEKNIRDSELRLKQQTDSITKQNATIKNNAKALEAKNEKISMQNKINYLLIGLFTLSLIGAYLLYRNINNKKKIAQTLKEKNAAITKQSFELEAKNNELEQFAYIASHDLKEPLITISSLIDILVEDYGTKFDEDGRMSLNFVKDSSDRMKRLIDAILAYSRLGKTKEYGTVNCNTVIDTLKDDLQNVITRTNSKVQVTNLPTIKGAELEIRLLFQNLISNGIKFTKPDIDPLIEVDAKKVNIKDIEYWQFTVRDNGIGIPKKHQERIFSIFQRLHSREEYEGTGIGLAHCKKIVESHGGKIWLDSEEHIGTTFFFTIPV
ncbi:YfiR/HmsC family protein [uncultured Lacinutrix sp.]|uniref:YfiR/HmsC family protein n=1 Tax=uncultured Lacinutrix sp. TaxID=574032 RepID=UPI0026110F25|nr:YfiR/HmsC family protein [uncultured Lacinutrix sp.]